MAGPAAGGESADAARLELKAVSDAPDPFGPALGSCLIAGSFEVRPTGSNVDERRNEVTRLLRMTVVIKNAAGQGVRSLTAEQVVQKGQPAGRSVPLSLSVAWDGKATDGVPAPDGVYSYRVSGAYILKHVVVTPHGSHGQESVQATSGAMSGTVVLDTAKPEIAGLLPAPGSFVGTSRPTLAASWSDAGSGLDLGTAAVRLDGLDVTSLATVTATGFTLALPAHLALAEGQHVVNVEIADLAGNRREAGSAFVVDLTPPVVTGPMPAPDSYTKSDRPTIGAGYTDARSGVAIGSVRLWLDGADVSAMATILPAAVAFIPEVALTEGPHAARLVVADLVGNVATAEWSFIVDTVAPQLSELSPAEGSATNHRRPVMSGRAADPGSGLASVQVLLDGAPVFTSLDAGAFSATPEADLAEGRHTWKVVAADVAGNIAEVSVGFLTDYTPPGAPVIGTLTATADRVTIHGDTEPDVVEVLASAEGAAVERAVVESYTVVFVPLAGGPTTFGYEIRFKDRAGNIGPALTGTASFQPEVPPPVISGLAVREEYFTEFDPEAGYFTKLSQVQLIGTVSGGTRPFRVTITAKGLDSGEEIAASQQLDAGSVDQISLMVPVFEEANEVSVKVMDANGQEATAGPLKVTSDRTMPCLVLESPTKMTSWPLGSLYLGFRDVPERNVFDIRTFSVKIRATDPTSLGGALTATATCGSVSLTSPVLPDAEGDYMLELPAGFLSSLGDGQYVLQISLRDRSGNSRALAYAIVRDTVAPRVYGYDPDLLGVMGTTFWTEITRIRLVGADGDAIRVERGAPLVKAWLNGPWLFGSPYVLDDSSDEAVLEFVTEDFAGNVGAPALRLHLWPREVEVHYYPSGGRDLWGRNVPAGFTMTVSPTDGGGLPDWPHARSERKAWASSRVAWTLKVFQPGPENPEVPVEVLELNDQGNLPNAGRAHPVGECVLDEFGVVIPETVALGWAAWVPSAWTEMPPWGEPLVMPWDWFYIQGGQVASASPAVVPLSPDWTGEWLGRPLPASRFLDFDVQPVGLAMSEIDGWLGQIDNNYGQGLWEKYAAYGPMLGRTQNEFVPDPWGWGYWLRRPWAYFEDPMLYDPAHLDFDWTHTGRWIPVKPPSAPDPYWPYGATLPPGLATLSAGLFMAYYGYPGAYPYYGPAVRTVEDYRKVNVIAVGESGCGYVLAAGQKAAVRFRGGNFGETGDRPVSSVRFLIPGSSTADPNIEILAVRVVEHDPFQRDIVKCIEADVVVADAAELGFRDAEVTCGQVDAIIKAAVRIETGMVSPSPAIVVKGGNAVLTHGHGEVTWLLLTPTMARITAGFKDAPGGQIRCAPFDPTAYYRAVEIEGLEVGTAHVRAGGAPTAVVYVVAIENVRSSDGALVDFVNVERADVVNAVAFLENPPEGGTPADHQDPSVEPYWLTVTGATIGTSLGGSEPLTRLSNWCGPLNLVVNGHYFLEGAVIKCSTPDVQVGTTTRISAERLEAAVSVRNGSFAHAAIWVENPGPFSSKTVVPVAIGLRYEFGSTGETHLPGLERFPVKAKAPLVTCGYEDTDGIAAAEGWMGHLSTRTETRLLVDVPVSAYRIELTIGHPTQPVGPVTVSIDGTTVEENVIVAAGQTRTLVRQVASSSGTIAINLARGNGAVLAIRRLEVVRVDGCIAGSVAHSSRHGMYVGSPSSATLTLRAQGCDFSNGQIKVVIPDALPAPQHDDPDGANYVSATGIGGANTSIATVSGRDIIINALAMPPGSAAVLQYGVTGTEESPLPGVTPEVKGSFPLIVESKLSGGTFIGARTFLGPNWMGPDWLGGTIEVVDPSDDFFPMPLPDDPPPAVPVEEPAPFPLPVIADSSEHRLAVRCPSGMPDGLIASALVMAQDERDNDLMAAPVAVTFASHTFPDNGTGLIATTDMLLFEGDLLNSTRRHFAERYLLLGGQGRYDHLRVQLCAADGQPAAEGRKGGNAACELGLKKTKDAKEWTAIELYRRKDDDKTRLYKPTGSPQWSVRCVMEKDAEGRWKVKSSDQDTALRLSARTAEANGFPAGDYTFKLKVSNGVAEAQGQEDVTLAAVGPVIEKELPLSRILGYENGKLLAGPGELRLEVQFTKKNGNEELARCDTMLDVRTAGFMIANQDENGAQSNLYKKADGTAESWKHYKNREADAREIDELVYLAPPAGTKDKYADMGSEYVYRLGTVRKDKTWTNTNPQVDPPTSRKYSHPAQFTELKEASFVGADNERCFDWSDLSVVMTHGMPNRFSLKGPKMDKVVRLTGSPSAASAWGKLDLEWAISDSCILFSDGYVPPVTDTVRPHDKSARPKENREAPWESVFSNGLHGVCGFVSRGHPNVRDGFDRDHTGRNMLRQQWATFLEKSRDPAVGGIGDAWNESMATHAHWYRIYNEENVYFAVPAFICEADAVSELLPWGADPKEIKPDKMPRIEEGKIVEKLSLKQFAFLDYVKKDTGNPNNEAQAIADVSKHFKAPHLHNVVDPVDNPNPPDKWTTEDENDKAVPLNQRNPPDYKFNVGGTVQEKGIGPLAGVQVSVESDAGQVGQAVVTGVDGKYQFPPVAPSVYRLVVRRNNEIAAVAPLQLTHYPTPREEGGLRYSFGPWTITVPGELLKVTGKAPEGAVKVKAMVAGSVAKEAPVANEEYTMTLWPHVWYVLKAVDGAGVEISSTPVIPAPVLADWDKVNHKHVFRANLVKP